MAQGTEGTIRRLAQEYTTPSRHEVVRAKRLIMERLAGGAPVIRHDLVMALATSEGVEAKGGLDIVDPARVEESVSRDHPVLAHHRFRFAAIEAIGELLANGMVVPAHPTTSPSQADEGAAIRISYSLPGMGTSVEVKPGLPHLRDAAYRLPHGMLERDSWLVDADLFLEGIEGLELAGPARRCLDEALRAYRRDLHIAAASLLGATYEGAWFAAGERMRSSSKKLAEALDRSDTAKVQERVADQLRAVSRIGTVADELHSHAAFLRELRNYGVHPRETDEDLEKYLTEDQVGLLIMTTRGHLRRLAEAAAAWEEEHGPAS